MTADKTKTIAKESTTSKAPATQKKAIKPAVPKAEGTPKRITKKTVKAPKVKMVRSNFSIPKTEYRKIAEIKAACLKSGLRVKKSEVLRAGLKAVGEMDGAQLKSAMAGLGKAKTNRPKK